MRRSWYEIKGFLLLLAIVAGVLSIDILLVTVYYHRVEHFIDKQPVIGSADAGIVFFGDYNKDGTQLGSDSKKRAMVAVHLFEQNQIKYIISVGGFDYRHWAGKPNLMKNFLVSKGLPPSRIIYDSLSFNTITNWEEAQKIIRRKHFQKIVIISAPLHVYRIMHFIHFKGAACASYNYKFNDFSDYWVFYKDVHHEWVSIFLSFVLKDEVRNRIVYIFRTVMSEVNDFL